MKQDKFQFATVYRNINSSLCIHFSDAENVTFELLCGGRVFVKEMTRKEFARFLKEHSFKFCHRETWC